MVTGLQAADAAATQLGAAKGGATPGSMAEAELQPLDVEETEAHVALARRANSEVLGPPLKAVRAATAFLPFGGPFASKRL